MDKIRRVDAVRLRLASPTSILINSFGAVTSPELVDPRTGRPAHGGLFCERIFGPLADGQCACGKFIQGSVRVPEGVVCGLHGLETQDQWQERVLDEETLDEDNVFRPYQVEAPGHNAWGILCDVCHVEVGPSQSRRERMAHIQLASPVCHPWFSGSGYLSPIGLLLDRDDLSPTVGDDPLARLLTTADGAETVRGRLEKIDLDQLANRLRQETSEARGRARRRLQVVEELRRTGQRPEWMVLTVLPVLPPGLRPLTQGTAALADDDLNRRYVEVIERNNRMERLLQSGAEQDFLDGAKRLLQEAVRALFACLQLRLTGESGRFRHDLLSKRVDFSGRSVAVPGPELRLDQCGLPKHMALELFKPFLIRHLPMESVGFNLRRMLKVVQEEGLEVWRALQQALETQTILVSNPVPRDRRGIMAFQPVLVDGNAIRVHPLVAAQLGIGFQGDELNVHVPLFAASRREALERMVPSKNLSQPSNGDFGPPRSLDVELGCRYLTTIRPRSPGEASVFSNVLEARLAYDLGVVGLQTAVKVRIRGLDGQTELLETSVGRMIFNEVIGDCLRAGGHEPLEFRNHTMHRSALQSFFRLLVRQRGIQAAGIALDEISRLGLRVATRAGLTIAVDDFAIPATSGILSRPPSARGRLLDAGGRLKRAADLTRRIVAAAADVTITEQDCGTLDALQIGPRSRFRTQQLVGRFAASDVLDERGDVLVRRGTLITEQELDQIRGAAVSRAGVRSALTCQTRRGLCQRCYGWDATRREPVELGATVGVIAAQSIGASARGVAARQVDTDVQGNLVLPRLEELFEAQKSRDRWATLHPEGDAVVGGYLVDEVQRLLLPAGISLDDKHIELVVREMLGKVHVDTCGASELLPGQLVERFEYERVNRQALLEGGEPARGRRLLLGITHLALNSPSFMASAAFGHPSQVLADAALAGQTDWLVGVTANCVVGRPLSAVRTAKDETRRWQQRARHEQRQREEARRKSRLTWWDDTDPFELPIGRLYVRGPGAERELASSELVHGGPWTGWRALGPPRVARAVPGDVEVGLKLTDEEADDLSPLARLPSDALQALDLQWTGVASAELACVAHLTDLRSLDLSWTKITDWGLDQIDELSNLEELRLWGTLVSDAGLVNLRGMSNLRLLDLADTEVTDVELGHLARLTRLEDLDLANTRVTDVGLRQLAGLSRLQRLRLAGTAVTDAGLRHLAALTALRDLDVSDTGLTDAAAVHLAAFAGLECLDLSNTAVTPTAVEELRRAVPSLGLVTS